MVKLLIKNRAGVNRTGNHRDELSPNGIADDWTPLHVAAHAGRIEVAEYLLTKGADIQAKCTCGDEGLTPLHMAARNGHENTVKMLLTKGADASLKSKAGRTPMDLAKEKNHPEVVELLSKHEAKDD
jgi:ankyrin repeat protein